jgi:hypothetical protein
MRRWTVVIYGRDDQEWETLINAGLRFLTERARLQKPTSYTELNAALAHRTGIRAFDFDRADERAAMGYLLGSIVERNLPETGLMISALVNYLNANDAGSGFYKLATELGLLKASASSDEKITFWIAQIKGLYARYGPST